METKNSTEKVVTGFKKAAIELEKFQLQFALGKAEAKDKYEEVKKQFNQTVHSAKLKAIKAKEKADDLHGLFDELMIQLALGKAETKDAFIKQQKKINTKIHSIELYIKSHPNLMKIYDKLLEEFEKLKIQLEILAVNYRISNLTTNDSIEQRRKEMDVIIKGLQDSLKKHKKPVEKTKWENFESEMGEAYKHLKAAFVK